MFLFEGGACPASPPLTWALPSKQLGFVCAMVWVLPHQCFYSKRAALELAGFRASVNLLVSRAEFYLVYFWQKVYRLTKNSSVLPRGLRLQSSSVEQVVGWLARLDFFVLTSHNVGTALDMYVLAVN